MSNKVKPYEKKIVNAVIGFMKAKFNFDAKIIVKKKDKDGLIGDVILNNNSVNNNKFYLHFNPDQSYAMMIQALIHELTHVKQISRKELLPSDDYKAVLWRGKEFISASEYKKLFKKYSEYKKLPWEAEAYSNMKKLYKPFLSSKQWTELSGDANIDFIKQNIGEVKMKKSEIREIIKEELQSLNEGKKVYFTMDNLGSAKYSVSFYDGKKTHPDGSDFYGLHLFKNKKKYEAYIKELKSQGYTER